MNQSQILVTGANGQLGKALREQYPKAQFTTRETLDITDQASIDTYDWSNVSVIINAAGYTNVDGAETDEGRIAAWQANATALSHLAIKAREHDAVLIHISSEYVFDGTKEHTEDELLSPLSSYGASKAAGDLAVSLVPKHYILRTSWVIGDGKNFVQTMLGLGKKGIEPTVVADQIGRLTFTSELVRAINHLLETQSAYGVYNLSNDGDSTSWADVTRAVFKEANYDLHVTDTTTAEYFAQKTGIAVRPLNSILKLDKIHATGFTSTDWRDDLHKYVKKESV